MTVYWCALGGGIGVLALLVAGVFSIERPTTAAMFHFGQHGTIGLELGCGDGLSADGRYPPCKIEMLGKKP